MRTLEEQTAAARQVLRGVFGFDGYRPGQEAAIAALTATADEATREDIAKRLFWGSVESFVLGFDRPNIKLSVEMKRDWKRQLRDFIARHEGENGIVYCLSRKKTEKPPNTDLASSIPAHAAHRDPSRPKLDKTIMQEAPGLILTTIPKMRHTTIHISNSRSCANSRNGESESAENEKTQSSRMQNEMCAYGNRLQREVHRIRLSLPFIPSIAETLEFCITTGYPFRHA